MRNVPIQDVRVVIIDPGHGDPDGGAVGVDGVLEKDQSKMAFAIFNGVLAFDATQ